MKLLIIRHGQSANNLLRATTGSFAGRSPDPMLTQLGKTQADALAAAMLNGAQPAPDVLYSSLMLRAVQTAAPIAAALGLPIIGHLEAYECGGPYLGSPQNPIPYPGAPASTLREISPELELPAGVDESGWYREAGEDDLQRAARGKRVIAGLTSSYLGKEILVGVVCHEWISQHLIRASLDFDAPGGIAEPWFQLDNTATTLIDFEQPVPATEASHNGGEFERILAWHNNSRHLTAQQVSG